MSGFRGGTRVTCGWLVACLCGSLGRGPWHMWALCHGATPYVGLVDTYLVSVSKCSCKTSTNRILLIGKYCGSGILSA